MRQVDLEQAVLDLCEGSEGVDPDQVVEKATAFFGVSADDANAALERLIFQGEVVLDSELAGRGVALVDQMLAVLRDAPEDAFAELEGDYLILAQAGYLAAHGYAVQGTVKSTAYLLAFHAASE